MGPALAKGVHKWPNKYINEKKALLAKNRQPFPKLNWSDNPRPVQSRLGCKSQNVPAVQSAFWLHDPGEIIICTNIKSSRLLFD